MENKTMKTLQELKNKCFKVERTIHSMSIDAQIELLKKRLQPEDYCGQYHKENKITCTVADDKIIVTAPVFYVYTLSIPEAEIIEFEYKNFTSERVDALNRYLLTFTEVRIPYPLYPEKQEVSSGFVEIKSSGAYVFNGWNGDPIKKDDLIKNEAGDIIGFKKLTYRNELIEYKFMGE